MSDCITVTIAKTQGSAPRSAGTSMQVFADHIQGTIGGGALEWEAMRVARDMLRDGRDQHHQTIPLGPNLGQCCGGSVTLDFVAGSLAAEPTENPLWIWGAGHVGLAIAQIMAPFEDRVITLIDTSAERMPGGLPQLVQPLIAVDPVKAVAHAPADADHLILTYSHEIDLALCDALLRVPTKSIGLIGSETKWARFQKRLAEMGHSQLDINKIRCPIGDPTLGKHPQSIAIGIALSYKTAL